MTVAPEMKKKTSFDQVTQIINRILDEAAKSREGFTPEVINQFYKEGQAARQNDEQKTKIARATPTKQIGTIVARKSEPKEDVRKADITIKVGEKAIDASVDLAERLELATRGKKLDLRDWVTG
jgi:hypothetical protein